MRRTNHPRSTRGGFTLVELLVVITIISILLALISSAVLNAFNRGTDVQARNDVSQLAAAMQAFQTQLSAKYVPDRLILPPGYDTTGATAQFLKSVWPRLDARTLGTGTTQFTMGTGAAQRTVTVFDYWQVQGNQAQTLQGDQVLVWALGGWRSADSVFGFSTDPTDPMKPYTAGQQRTGPFYDGFTTERLVIFPGNTSTPRAAGFPSFVDVYGKVPYMYFSSNKAGNDYTTVPHNVPSVDASGQIVIRQMLPFQLSKSATNVPVKYAQANGFQIICAGRDNQFGAGGDGWSGVANAILSAGVKDDIANFHAGRLGD